MTDDADQAMTDDADRAGEEEAAAGREVRRLMIDLPALPDRSVRQVLVAERLRDLPVGVALRVLAELWRRAASRDPACQELLLDLTTTRPLEESLGYGRVRMLYEGALEQGMPEVARLFFGHAAVSAGAVRPERENEKLASVPLGRRRALARGRDRMKIDRLLFDRNPMVVRVLLDNPRLTEADVVRMAAMRPAVAESLQHIHHHPRWIASYRVKKTLVLNPYTPVDIALGLLVHLLRQDLWQAARAETLHEAVRVAARELLDHRDGRTELARIDPPLPGPEPRLAEEELLRALEKARRRE